MPVAVSAADTAGNVASVDGGHVRLTRWRWSLVIPELSNANRSSAVAIDQSGLIYAVTQLADGGTLNAYTPEGERLFRRTTLGAPLPPVVGAFAGPNGVMAYLTECDGPTCSQVSAVAYGLRNGSTPAVTWQAPAARRDFNMPVVASSVVRNAETAFLSWTDPATNRPALGWRSLIGAGADDGGVLLSSGPATASLLGPLVANGRNLFVADFDSNKVFGFESTNNFTSPVQSSLGFPGTAAGVFTMYNLLIDSTGALIGSGSSASGNQAFRLTYPATVTLGPNSPGPLVVMLSAVIVDSRGVDATADWPLVRHDPRNTNDRAASLVPYTCP